MLFHTYSFHRPCIFHTHSMHIPCIFHACSMHMPCICHTYSTHVPCSFHTDTIHIPCIFHAHSMLTSCLLHAHSMRFQEIPRDSLRFQDATPKLVVCILRPCAVCSFEASGRSSERQFGLAAEGVVGHAETLPNRGHICNTYCGIFSVWFRTLRFYAMAGLSVKDKSAHSYIYIYIILYYIILYYIILYYIIV